MVTDIFNAILTDLGNSLKISNLHSDQNNTCLIKLANGLKIQLELDKTGRQLIIASEIGILPTGRYRETILREALKSNGLTPKRTGIFAYSKKADKIILFEMMPLLDINNSKILDVITPLSEKALIWSTALVKGDVPVFTATSTTSNIFGIR